MSPIASAREPVIPPSPCPNCGASVAPPVPPATEVKCPSCGTMLTLKKGKLVKA